MEPLAKSLESDVPFSCAVILIRHISIWGRDSTFSPMGRERKHDQRVFRARLDSAGPRSVFDGGVGDNCLSDQPKDLIGGQRDDAEHQMAHPLGIASHAYHAPAELVLKTRIHPLQPEPPGD